MDNPPLRMSFPLEQGSVSTSAMRASGATADVEVAHNISCATSLSGQPRGSVDPRPRPRLSRRISVYRNYGCNE